MANVIYTKLGDGSYMNQGYPGGPAVFRIQVNPSSPSALTAWDIYFSFNGETFNPMGRGTSSSASAQTNLDNYIASLIAGTAT
jgi:hypothetical protein